MQYIKSNILDEKIIWKNFFDVYSEKFRLGNFPMKTSLVWDFIEEKEKENHSVEDTFVVGKNYTISERFEIWKNDFKEVIKQLKSQKKFKEGVLDLFEEELIRKYENDLPVSTGKQRTTGTERKVFIFDRVFTHAPVWDAMETLEKESEKRSLKIEIEYIKEKEKKDKKPKTKKKKGASGTQGTKEIKKTKQTEFKDGPTSSFAQELNEFICNEWNKKKEVDFSLFFRNMQATYDISPNLGFGLIHGIKFHSIDDNINDLKSSFQKVEAMVVFSSTFHWNGNYFGTAFHNFTFQLFNLNMCVNQDRKKGEKKETWGSIIEKQGDLKFLDEGSTIEFYQEENGEIFLKVGFKENTCLFKDAKGNKCKAGKFTVVFKFIHYVVATNKLRNMMNKVYKVNELLESTLFIESLLGLFPVKKIWYLSSEKRGERETLLDFHNRVYENSLYFDMVVMEVGKNMKKFQSQVLQMEKSVPYAFECYKKKEPRVLYSVGFSKVLKFNQVAMNDCSNPSNTCF